MRTLADSVTSTGPIFVVGYMHSGTTMLQQILGSHPAVFSGRGESRFHDNLPAIRRAFPDLDNEETLHRYPWYLALVVHSEYVKADELKDFSGQKRYLQVEKGVVEEWINQLSNLLKGRHDCATILMAVFNYFAKCGGVAYLIIGMGRYWQRLRSLGKSRLRHDCCHGK